MRAGPRVARENVALYLLPLGLAFFLASMTGCAARASLPAAPAGAVVDSALAQQVIAASAPTRPIQAVFAWTLRDGDARFSGRGVARMAPPERVRLDLFGPRGETYLSAALVSGELRLPASATDVPLPPAELLWAAVGAVTPPHGATLVRADSSAGAVNIEYRRADELWRYRIVHGRLVYAEWQGQQEGRRTVELTGEAPNGLPQRAHYRDWIAFRELTLAVEQVDEVPGFPDDIWQLPR